jgi:hypothetical protein
MHIRAVYMVRLPIIPPVSYLLIVNPAPFSPLLS